MVYFMLFSTKPIYFEKVPFCTYLALKGTGEIGYFTLLKNFRRSFFRARMHIFIRLKPIGHRHKPIFEKPIFRFV